MTDPDDLELHGRFFPVKPTISHTAQAGGTRRG